MSNTPVCSERFSETHWKSLRYFNLYRLAVAALLFSAALLHPSAFAVFGPDQGRQQLLVLASLNLLSTAIAVLLAYQLRRHASMQVSGCVLVVVLVMSLLSELCGKGFSDLALQTVETMITDCNRFLRENEAHILRAKDEKEGQPPKYNEEMAGRDFWCTRNGHGVGFWDRGLGELGQTLTAAAKKYNTLEPYLGDDGKVWLG